MNRNIFSLFLLVTFSDSASRNKGIIFIYMRKIDVMQWDKYWLLTIISEEYWRKLRTFKCKCDCWNICIVKLMSLRWWNTKSCWCYRNDITNQPKTHWMTSTKIYFVYNWIKARCNNIKNKSYPRYWWRWIRCEWTSFEEFYYDMSESYKEWLQLDRIDVNWNYCKENCRWATTKEQSMNKRNTLMYKWMPLIKYCELNWISYNMARARIRRWKDNINF